MDEDNTISPDQMRARKAIIMRARLDARPGTNLEKLKRAAKEHAAIQPAVLAQTKGQTATEVAMMRQAEEYRRGER